MRIYIFDIQVLSKDRLSYRTDMRYKHEEIETYTLNLYDGKKSEEIAFNAIRGKNTEGIRES